MKLNKRQKKELVRIGAGVALYLAAVIAGHTLALPHPVKILLFVPGYFVLALPVLIKAAKNIAHGNMMDENFLMSIASIGAFILGEGSEGTAVMLFNRVGGFFEDYAVTRSRKGVTDLLSLCPEYATIERDGKLEQVSTDEIPVGSTVVVLPGERVPLDGEIVSGETVFDTSPLTGESIPRTARVGDTAVSGYINLKGKIEVRTQKEYEDSTVAKILSLIEDATEKKSKSEHLITRFARIYTPIVVALALALALIPSLLHAAFPALVPQGVGTWVYRAMLFLVVSCPCALVVSVPLGFFGGIGGASRKGVLIKGSNYLELLAKADTFVFDKTGTLTRGTFTVTELVPQGVDGQQLLALAASAERYSAHPIAAAIAASYTGDLREAQVEEVAGKGLRARIDGAQVLVGSAGLLKENGVAFEAPACEKTVVHIARDGVYCGAILISDTLKPDAADTVAALAPYAKTVMLSGDGEAVAHAVARELGIAEVHASLLPQDKAAYLEQLSKGHVCAFCGDGMNDAPSLALADVGIAMGGAGSGAAIEAADVVIMDDKPSKIVLARKYAKKTVRICRENIIFSLAIKCGVMVFGALGLASMWAAVFADVGVLIIAIANSMRASRV